MVGEEMYVIRNGQVVVYISHGDDTQQLATLGTGSFFGEGALLKGKAAKRAANVSSVSYSLIFSLHVDAMNKVCCVPADREFPHGLIL